MLDYTLIKNGIFIGNRHSVVTNIITKECDILEEQNIKVVISALTEKEYDDYIIGKEDFPNIEWHRLVIDDDEKEDISKYFSKVNKIINEAITRDKNVIVHCAGGISRSPTLVIAYLMIQNKWNYEEAFNFVKRKRPHIEPNIGFIRQLKELEHL